jgi:hypothetical protein
MCGWVTLSPPFPTPPYREGGRGEEGDFPTLYFGVGEFIGKMAPSIQPDVSENDHLDKFVLVGYNATTTNTTEETEP